jgi:Raf kinase inhibitor-like YbhB/YbcL family protein
MPLQLTSPAFSESGGIPREYTCDGEDVSPALEWKGLPPGTGSLALIVDDPDAPDPKAPKMTYVHWVLYDIPTSEVKIGRGGSPKGARDGKNDWKRTGYGGPCPPIGRHRYFFKLYALDAMLGDLQTPTKDRLLAAMKGHIIEETQLMGTYQRSKS